MRLHGCLVPCGPLHCAVLVVVLCAARPSAELPRAHPNDNRQSAGVAAGGTVVLELEVRLAAWFPEAADGAFAAVAAFAERGREPSIPGPLIRVRQGALLRVSVHNTLGDTLYVFGLHARAGGEARPAPLRVAPGETRAVSFPADLAGTYLYWAGTSAEPDLVRAPRDTQLNGALVVDPRDGTVAPDRIFLMSIFGGPPQAGAEPRVVMAINGRSFPHTERLEYTENDTVRWRVINATRAPHPMHLHGFYYHIEAHSDNLREHKYAPDREPFVVTDHLRPGHSMSMRFVPHERGYWAFHCHFAFHSGGHLGLTAHEEYGEPAHGTHSMAGLVLVFYVHPNPLKPPAPEVPARPLRILVRESTDTTGPAHRMSFLAHDGAEPALADVSLPSTPLVLRRAERVAITIVNRLREPTQIHWHGIELESYPDGIPGISGVPGRINPPIAPGDSFTAVFAPPRAGTFIYHAHMNDGLQINLGLYGALIVVEDDRVWDRDRDHVVLVGGGGRVYSDRLIPGFVNGMPDPPALVMRAGETHRLRLISIHPDDQLRFALVSETGELMRWRAVAKDGAELGEAQRQSTPATLLTGPGETADFEFTPEIAGNYRLEIKGGPVRGPGWYITQPIRVR